MTQKLLFADDSLTMHRVVAITFGQENVTLVSAHSGAEALGLARTTTFDVALLDVHLGDTDGYSLCSELQRQRGPGAPLPVLLLVSDQHPVDAERLQASGAVGAVKKPFDTQTLVARVREACASGAQAPALAHAPQPVPKSPAAAAPPPRPAFFQSPPPIPAPGAREAAGAAQSPQHSPGWSVHAGGPPPVDAAQLPQMPNWSIDLNPAKERGEAAPLPQQTPPEEPLWTEKESTTAEDLRRPEIDVGIVQMAREDSAKGAQMQPPDSAVGLSRAPTAVATATAQALTQALSGMPEATAKALGPNFAAELAQVLVQAIERAVWDVLPIIAQQQAHAYFECNPPQPGRPSAEP